MPSYDEAMKLVEEIPKIKAVINDLIKAMDKLIANDGNRFADIETLRFKFDALTVENDELLKEIEKLKK